VLPNEAQQHCDTVICGEAEELWPQFLEDFEAGHPRERYQNEAGCYPDITRSPVPRFSLLNSSNHKNFPDRQNMITLQTGRGCPHACEFCSATRVWGSRFRAKTVDQVIQEVREVKRHFVNPLIGFADDNMFIKRDRAKEILRALIPERVQWVTQTDLSIADDEELLELCFRSGCNHVVVGFESLHPENLTQMNRSQFKRRLLDTMEDKIAKLHSAGIVIYAMIILGLDHDTREVMKATRDFIRDNHLFPHYAIVTALPGTALYDRIQAEGRFLKDNFWDLCTFFNVTIRPNKMTPDEVILSLIWLYSEAFSAESAGDRQRFVRQMYRRALRRYSLN